LKCVSKWGRASASDAPPAPTTSTAAQPGWRCPGCQNVSTNIPNAYTCFCGKAQNPPVNHFLVPHSCGETCLKERGCPHKCSVQCHPGPCKPCEAMAPPVSCHCKRSTFVVRCSELANVSFDPSCGEICDKELNCGNHKCTRPCHSGPCLPCDITFTQNCHCGRSEKTIPCGTPPTLFSCTATCEQPFSCGIHSCQRGCHPLANHTTVCPSDPAVIRRCPCGTKTVDELTHGNCRQTCEDPIPTCDGVCKKVLFCGHRCEVPCHVGECPPCQESMVIPCRCGRTHPSIPCSTLERDPATGEPLPPLCDRVCTTMRHCRRHRCGDRCCPVVDFHVCDLVCAKTLRCGKHNCTLGCGHEGRCHDCMEGVSFEELACNCGLTRIFPPIACGTAPPTCTQPCTRPSPCGHPRYGPHNCHGDDEPCPPCVIFVERNCACGKKSMKNIPCSRQGLPSCGESCGRTIPGCGHVCQRFCHSGSCTDETNRCTAKCGRSRSVCGHTCGFTCHGKAYCAEDRPCLAKLSQACRCGNKVQQIVCGAWKESIGKSAASPLPCDETCALAERNRRLAEALEVDTSPNAPPITEYDDALLRYAHHNLAWARTVEKTLKEFLEDRTKRTHHFPHTRSGRAPFIAGLAVHYNLVGEVVDADSGRGSVIVRKTASRLPAVPHPLISSAAARHIPS
ncbi:hypothetical protein BDK51DRAFT_13552, partial [Blyttiomyces helicus]